VIGLVVGVDSHTQGAGGVVQPRNYRSLLVGARHERKFEGRGPKR